MSKIKLKRILNGALFILVLFAMNSFNAMAETIKLKDGRVVEGRITDDASKMIYFINKKNNKSMKVRKNKIDTIDNIPVSDWIKSKKGTSNKKSSRFAKNSSGNITLNEFVVSFGYDTLGKISYGGDLNDKTDTDKGTSIGGEFAHYFQNYPYFGMGLGVLSQQKRKEQLANNVGGNFQFTPIFLLMKWRAIRYKSQPYFVIHGGINQFKGDDTFKINGSVKGKAYYGIGCGISLYEYIRLEFLFSTNEGKLEFPVAVTDYWGTTIYNITSDFYYTSLRISIGLKFNI